MPPELDTIAESLREGRSIEPVTVRVFLDWFGAKRRGVNVVGSVRSELKKVGLHTEPDFESAWMETPISFVPTSMAKPERLETEIEDPPILGAPAADDSSTATGINRDPSHRISRLEAANVKIVSVAPDDTITKAVTLMLSHDFSQLPVMRSPRDLKGMISWKSIGSRIAVGIVPERVRDAMEQAHEVSANVSIFDAITLIARHDHIVVRAVDNTVTGIVTASDLSVQFQTLTEPFLVLSEIENLIRNMLEVGFTHDELTEVRETGSGERRVESAADLTFGEYVRLLQKPDRWSKLGLKVDRDVFCKALDDVRKVRNDVMHFDPDGITSDDLNRLRTFARFLGSLVRIRK